MTPTYVGARAIVRLPEHLERVTSATRDLRRQNSCRASVAEPKGDWQRCAELEREETSNAEGILHYARHAGDVGLAEPATSDSPSKCVPGVPA